MGLQTFFFFKAHIKEFNLEAPSEHPPDNTEITYLPLRSPSTSDGWPPPRLLKPSTYEKGKNKSEGASVPKTKRGRNSERNTEKQTSPG